MSERREFSSKVKVAAFERAKGHCEECGARLVVGKFHYDHMIADALGGEPTLENCAVLCVSCHGLKTPEDTTKAAKVKRIRRNYIGAKSRPRNLIPGSRGTPWKRKINGQTERRT